MLGHLHRIGSDHRLLGQHADAHPLLQQALEGYENVLGPDGIETLQSANSLGLNFHDQGKFSEAEPLFRRAADGSKRKAGLEEISTLLCMNNLGVCLQSQSRHEEAFPLLQLVMSNFEKLLGPSHAATLNVTCNVATSMSEAGQWAEAEGMLRKATAGMQRALGVEHPTTLSCQTNLAICVASLGRIGEAQGIIYNAYQIFEKVLTKEHPWTMACGAALKALLEVQPPSEDAGTFQPDANNLNAKEKQREQSISREKQQTDQEVPRTGRSPSPSWLPATPPPIMKFRPRRGRSASPTPKPSKEEELLHGNTSSKGSKVPTAVALPFPPEDWEDEVIAVRPSVPIEDEALPVKETTSSKHRRSAPSHQRAERPSRGRPRHRGRQFVMPVQEFSLYDCQYT